MKNVVYFLVIVFLGLSLAGCTGGSLSIGDKNSQEVKESRDFFLDCISSYKDEISNLKSENLLLQESQESEDISSAKKEECAEKIKANNLEINKYQQKISLVEESLYSFIENSAGKVDKTRISLYGGEPLEMAEAYATIKYVDNTSGYHNAASTVSDGANKTGLVGIVENATGRNRVLVKITGPGAYLREFILTARQKSGVFNLPMPGNYMATFIDGYNQVSVFKKVGQNIVYYDSSGEAYDFKATLLR